ncbi:GerAB/ArcD/ProY family transporter [Peribacillus frigoritolerans]
MGQIKEKIGIKEFIAIFILSIGPKLTDDTPAILYGYLENAAWMTPIIIGVISIIPIYFLTKVITLYQRKSLIDIIIHLFGKYIGFFLLFILWIIQSYGIIIDSATYTDIIGTMYFTNTPTLVAYALLMAISAYGAKKGLEHIGSFAWTVFTLIKVSTFIVFIMTFVQGNFDYAFPIFGPGKWEIIKESTTHLSLLIDFLYLGLIVPFIKSSSDYKKGTWFALAFLITEFSIALIGYVILFDHEAVKMFNYPFHESIRYIQFGFLTNIEFLFFPFWIVSSFVRFAFYLYLNALLFGGIFKIKQFEYIIPTLATLFVFLGMIPENPTFIIFHLRENFLHLITPVFFLLPCLLWVMAKLKGDLKSEKANASK